MRRHRTVTSKLPLNFNQLQAILDHGMSPCTRGFGLDRPTLSATGDGHRREEGVLRAWMRICAIELFGVLALGACTHVTRASVDEKAYDLKRRAQIETLVSQPSASAFATAALLSFPPEDGATKQLGFIQRAEMIAPQQPEFDELSLGPNHSNPAVVDEALQSRSIRYCRAARRVRGDGGAHGAG